MLRKKDIKPISFNMEMTVSLLNKKKCETRMVFSNLQNLNDNECIVDKKIILDEIVDFEMTHEQFDVTEKYSKYKKNDILFVREPVKVIQSYDSTKKMEYIYLADNKKEEIKIPKRFFDKNESFVHTKWIKNCERIPFGCIKEMSRIFLKITDVKIEKLKDITTLDILKEGCPFLKKTEQFEWWVSLWNSKHKEKFKWEDNPYVFVYSFEIIDF